MSIYKGTRSSVKSSPKSSKVAKVDDDSYVDRPNSEDAGDIDINPSDILSKGKKATPTKVPKKQQKTVKGKSAKIFLPQQLDLQGAITHLQKVTNSNNNNNTNFNNNSASSGTLALVTDKPPSKRTRTETGYRVWLPGESALLKVKATGCHPIGINSDGTIYFLPRI